VNIENHEENLFHHGHNDEKNEGVYCRQRQDKKNKINGRRAFVQGMLAPLLVVAPKRSTAVQGAVTFPCVKGLGNIYHFLRAGESMLEEEGVWTTNPLFLTNQDSVLSLTGISQVENACKTIKDNGITITLSRYSLAANAIDSSNIVERQLGVGRDRLVPEFNFMDPRAIGMWDMSEKNITFPAILALDATKAGISGTGGRPPPNIDGTPHETLADQTVRLRQLLCVLETQYSGDTILLIFPDGTGPALLTCLIGGIPLNRVHEFEFQSGEVRLDINYKSAQDLADRMPSDKYLEELEDGKVKLKRLLENPEESLDVKDQEYEQELKLEQERQERKKNLEREQAIKREEEARLKKERQLANIARQKELEEESKKKRDAQLAELKKKKEAEITKLREKEKENKDKIREQIQAAEMKKQKEAEITKLREKEKEDRNRITKEIQAAETARRKEIEKEFKMSKDAQAGEIKRKKNINNEPGGIDLLVGGGALIGAGGAAYFFLQDTEDPEIDRNDRPEAALMQAEAVAKFKAEEEEKTARLQAEAVAKLKAEEEEEAARLQAEAVAKLKVEEEEEAARLRAEEVAKLKAEEEEEAARLQAEEVAKLKAEEEAARVQAEKVTKLKAEEEKAARLRAEEDAKIKAEKEQKAKEDSKKTKRERLTWNPDEDDGGLAWLDSLTDMMNEDDDDDKDEEIKSWE